MAECRRYLCDIKVLGPKTEKMIHDVDIRDELLRKIGEERGMTINERQEEENDRKQREIDPYLEAYRRATVTMSTQKGTRLFEETVPEGVEVDAVGTKKRGKTDGQEGPPRKRKRTIGTQTLLKGPDLDRLLAHLPVKQAKKPKPAKKEPAMLRSKPSASRHGEGRFTYKVSKAIPALPEI